MKIPGVFTTIKITHGQPIFLEKHQARLIAHAKQAGFQIHTTAITQKIVTWLQDHPLKDCVLKISILGEYKEPEILFATRELPQTSGSIRLISVPDNRDVSKVIKSIDRTMYEQAKQMAQAKGADDAIFEEDGYLIESTICNLFSLNKKGEIITPPIAGKGLAGVMRASIMENFPVREEPIPKTTNGPLVLTNSLRVQKASSLDGRILADGEVLLEKLKITINKAEFKYLSSRT
ncbi:MAG: aminotransferase class IV [Patescibacteria group bacterium]